MLGGLSLTVSPRFTPQFFVFGIAAGLVRGPAASAVFAR